jgi:CheY-like chemotaxis protein
MSPQLMIVDDATDQVYLMKMLISLVEPKIQVVSAANGDQALKILRTNLGELPQLIILDLKMAGKTGLEILKELKADSNLRRIPVCIFSNGEFEADICDAYELGASFYFKKPVGLVELKKFIEHFLGLWFNYASFCPR